MTGHELLKVGFAIPHCQGGRLGVKVEIPESSMRFGREVTCINVVDDLEIAAVAKLPFPGLRLHGSGQLAPRRVFDISQKLGFTHHSRSYGITQMMNRPS